MPQSGFDGSTLQVINLVTEKTFLITLASKILTPPKQLYFNPQKLARFEFCVPTEKPSPLVSIMESMIALLSVIVQSLWNLFLAPDWFPLFKPSSNSAFPVAWVTEPATDP